MRLKLVIADERPEIITAWSKVFADMPEVTVLHSDIHTLRASPNIDAELMMGMFAHERLGGSPRPGKSQILSTRGEPGLPPWVVTTAPFAAHIELGHDGEYTVVQDRQLTIEEEDYIVFSEVFRRVREFNADQEQPQIRTLSIPLEFLNFPRSDAHSEAQSILKAYLEQDAQG
jgi:hypothetical protein